jgi:peptide/nickel transport system permease protein
VTAFVVRRLLASAILLLGVTFVTFVLFFEIPEDPALLLVGPPHPGPVAQQQKYQRAVTAAEHELGIDRPIYVQYERYVQRLARGSLGKSFATGQDVKGMLKTSAQVTGWLVLGGVVMLLAIAVPLGVIAGLHAGRILDRAILALTLVGASVPPFLIAYTLYLQLEPKLGMLGPQTPGFPRPPISGYCPPLGGTGCGSGPHGFFLHLIMPWFAFALGLIGLYVRLVRAGLLDLVDEPFVRTARAKGASETRVLRVHVLRNLWPSLATMLSMDIGLALGTAVFIEVAFGLPGLGQQTYEALVNPETLGYDLPVIAGVVLIAATVVVLLNLLVDVASARLDPRIRIAGSVGGR